MYVLYDKGQEWLKAVLTQEFDFRFKSGYYLYYSILIELEMSIQRKYNNLLVYGFYNCQIALLRKLIDSIFDTILLI